MKSIAIIAFAVVAASLVSAEDPTTAFKVFGNLYAMNNNWGDPGNTIISEFDGGPEAAVTTKFNFNNKGLYGYPAICRGWHYNINPVPSDTLFPAQPASLSKIPVTMDYMAEGTNLAGDFAYDMFLRKDTTKTTPQLEIMIWGDHNSIPLGSKTGTAVLEAGGRTYDLWQGNNDSAGYYVYSFVPTDSVGTDIGQKPLATKGTLNLDVKPFLDYLKMNRAADGKYDDKMYLHVIEVGFEIANGSGEVKMAGTIDAIKA